jgi:hypothetical protein
MFGRLFTVSGVFGFVTFAGQQSRQLVLANANSSASSSAASSGSTTNNRSPATHDNFTDTTGGFSQPAG